MFFRVNTIQLDLGLSNTISFLFSILLLYLLSIKKITYSRKVTTRKKSLTFIFTYITYIYKLYK
jgi:hypothetical protein